MTSRRWGPALLAFAAQAVAVAILLGIVQGAWHLAGWALPVWLKLAIVSGSAASITLALALPRWWTLIQLALPPLVYFALIQNLPAWPFALGFVLLAFVFSNSAGDRVPLYLSNRQTSAAVSRIAARQGPVRFIDLGCGLGGTLLTLARSNTHPDSRFRGVETAPLPYFISKLRCWLFRDSRIEVLSRSMWDEALGSWDVIYAFLSPAPMPRLLEKASNELGKNSILISNSFIDPSYPPSTTERLDDGRQTRLHVWRGPPRRNDSGNGKPS